MGLTSAGLEIPTVEELIEGFVDEQRSEIDPLLDVDAESPVGQLNGIVASALREAYEAIAVAYSAIDPDASEGDPLEVLCAITGTQRAAASPSRFAGVRKIRVELDASVTLAAGATCEVFGAPTIRFVTTEAVTSTSAGWYFVSATCTQTGPIDVAPNALSVITTPVAGWLAVDNPTGPVLGTNVDTEAELRDRRERELRALGSSPADAIAARIAAIEQDGERPVLSCQVFANTSSVTDSLGIPPHSIEALVWDGLDEDADDDVIAQTIWDAKAAGIGAFGSSSGTARDRNGTEHVVAFSRPTLRQAGVECLVAVRAVNATDAFKDALRAILVDEINAIPPGAVPTGGAIRHTRLSSALLAQQHVIAVDEMLVGFIGEAIPAGPYADRAVAPREKPFAELANVDLVFAAVP